MLKSVYVVAYLTAAVVVTVYAVMQLIAGQQIVPAIGLLLTSAPISLMIGAMMVLNNKARTSDRLRVVAVGAWLGSALTAYHHYIDGGSLEPLSIAVLMTALYYFYDYWYARLDRSASNLTVGKRMPPFELVSPNGDILNSEALQGSPSILIFYRGNWCPLCVAQVKEIAARYNDLKQKGVRVLLISPQSQRHTKSIATKFDAAMEFYQDKDNNAARTLGLENKYGTPFGMQVLGYSSHTVLPTVIITGSDGIVHWVHETDNYRVRPEPETYMAIMREKGLISAN
ncbi:peroxiredoxin-like family protein [Kordiimonas aquimaris]|uniref:peroxiredoxin-like family protein n=1 Tax=Kordiimonas aquimaris TaxID=707591 RepID=UPI0021D1B55B|nr:peroxiredoxin-like family protein [Kordiimonas aquimaris]